MMTISRRSEKGEVGPVQTGPTLLGTDDEVMLQALRNLWPILDTFSRRKATNIAHIIEGH